MYLQLRLRGTSHSCRPNCMQQAFIHRASRNPCACLTMHASSTRAHRRARWRGRVPARNHGGTAYARTRTWRKVNRMPFRSRARAFSLPSARLLKSRAVEQIVHSTTVIRHPIKTSLARSSRSEHCTQRCRVWDRRRKQVDDASSAARMTICEAWRLTTTITGTA